MGPFPNRLTQLTIENYRGIRKGTIGGLADVNLLVGRNNSGKSSVLEALAIAGSYAQGSRAYPSPSLRDQVCWRRQEGGIADTWWYQRDRTAPISFIMQQGK